MKKIITILLLSTIYCNSSFASSIEGSLLLKTMKRDNPNPSYKTLAIFESAKMSCRTNKEGTKKDDFIKEEVCNSNGSAGCLIYTDLKGRSPAEIYCVGKLDLL